MGKRRESRELAIQILYQMELRGEGKPDKRQLELFWGLFTGPFHVTSSVKEFSLQLVKGVIAHREEIDATIQRLANNWQLTRIALVDRNILRVALYEMLFCPEIPPIVSINEGVEIAKKFSTRESGRFVNGILDRIRAERTDLMAGHTDSSAAGCEAYGESSGDPAETMGGIVQDSESPEAESANSEEGQE
jgi:N utilization substance protein B